MESKLEQAYLMRWLKEDADAIAFVRDIARISQVWDDLIDGDVDRSPEDINEMMLRALTLQRNPFYARHVHDLLPIMEERIFTWMDSNALEQSGDEEKLRVSYILRSVITDIVAYVAGLVGGAEWRVQIGPEIRSVIYADNESFDDYCREHALEV